MEVQRIKADTHIAADRGLVALRYGPLIYNIERADQPDLNQAIGCETADGRMARRSAGRRDGHQGQMGRRQPAAGDSEFCAEQPQVETVGYDRSRRRANG